MIRFQNPAWLLLMLVVPVLLYRYIHRERRKQGRIRFSSIATFKQIPPSFLLTMRHSLVVFRCLSLALLVLAMARPQSGREGREILSQGIDIVLAVDVSSSMDTKDLDRQRKSRLTVCKEVVAQFVNDRTNDRLGLVVFAGESYTQCPLTLDYQVLLSFLGEIRLADESWDGTAIGSGIATAVNRLRGSEAKSKVVILLTDGQNNRGEIDPITAAKAAKAVGVRIYTIGAGSNQLRADLRVDEATLKEVADITGGRYYRATSEKKLEEIYDVIGEMEKTEIKTRDYVDYSEQFYWFLWPGMALLGMEALLANTRFRRLP